MRIGELTGLSHEQLARAMEIECECFTHPWTVADFDFVLTNGRAVNLGVWRRGELVGYVMALDEGNELHIVSLAVETRYRRRGWASHLLREVLVRGAGRGCRTCRLEVRQSNVAALGLYRELGFETVDVQAQFYTGPSEDALVLERRIDSAPGPAALSQTGEAGNPA